MKKTIKEFIVELYTALLEENINSWMKSEEVVKKSSLKPIQKIELQGKIKGISKKIAEEFADELIKQGYPEKEPSDEQKTKTLNKIVKKHMENLKNEKN